MLEPADEQTVDAPIPPCPPWARPDVHRRFWITVGRAVEKERLPGTVFVADDEAETEVEGASEDGGGGRVGVYPAGEEPASA